MQKQASFFPYFFIIAMMFILVGCGANVDRSVTFLRDEAWEADMEMSIPGEMLALLGSIDQLNTEITEQIADWEAKGANVSWKSSREDTTLVYTFHIKGTGWALLNEVIFENRAQITPSEVDGKRQVNFSYAASSDLLGANRNVITLIGGEIISSNGELLNSGQVQWVNPSGRINAVLTEKSGSGFVTFLLIVLMLGGLGGGFWYYRQKNNQSQLQPLPVEAAFCANCGASLSSQAKFCPICGQKQP